MECRHNLNPTCKRKGTFEMNHELRTPEQQSVINALTARFDIDAEGIRFLNPNKKAEPWFPAEVLQSIARQSERFRGISVEFATYIEPLKQIVYTTTVTDNENRIFTRSGSAGLSERLPDSDGAVADAHSLAASRSAVAGLTAAGFNPMKAASAVSLEVKLPSSAHREADQAQARLSDVQRIHILAKQKGLIKPVQGAADDRTDYVLFLTENFGETTSTALKPEQRAGCIAAMAALPDAINEESGG